MHMLKVAKKWELFFFSCYFSMQLYNNIIRQITYLFVIIIIIIIFMTIHNILWLNGRLSASNCVRSSSSCWLGFIWMFLSMKWKIIMAIKKEARSKNELGTIATDDGTRFLWWILPLFFICMYCFSCILFLFLSFCFFSFLENKIFRDKKLRKGNVLKLC